MQQIFEINCFSLEMDLNPKIILNYRTEWSYQFSRVELL